VPAALQLTEWWLPLDEVLWLPAVDRPPLTSIVVPPLPTLSPPISVSSSPPHAARAAAVANASDNNKRFMAEIVGCLPALLQARGGAHVRLSAASPR
jgi:hypothetical protein